MVINNLSLEINAGEIIGIFSKVGTGKTTLIKILSGYLQAPENSVFLNSLEINKYSLDELRQLVTVVPQEAFLFSLPLRDNIAFLEATISENALLEAVKLAQLESTVSSLPQGLHTLIGERGVTLSGGQKQRVTLARALLKPAPLLLFDDCFSSIDTETEEKILRELKPKLKNSTCIFISHRISTLRYAQRILVLHPEGIESIGTHEELLASNKYYLAMWQKQQLSLKLLEDS